MSHWYDQPKSCHHGWSQCSVPLPDLSNETQRTKPRWKIKIPIVNLLCSKNIDHTCIIIVQFKILVKGFKKNINMGFNISGQLTESMQLYLKFVLEFRERFLAILKSIKKKISVFYIQTAILNTYNEFAKTWHFQKNKTTLVDELLSKGFGTNVVTEMYTNFFS